MALDIRTSQQRAIAKMQALRWWRHVEQLRDGDYLVDGAARGVFYRVRHVGAAWTCDCPAGARGLPCYHAAAAWRLWLRDQAGQPPAPAPAPQPPAPDELPVAPRRASRGVTRTEEEEALLDQLYGPRPAN